MGSKYSVALCSAIVLCLIQDFVNCDGEWQVDYGTSVSHDNDHHGDKKQHSGLFTEKHHGGHKKGKSDWDEGKFKKHVQEWGDFGKQDHEQKEEHGDKYNQKHALDKHGENYALTHGGYAKHDTDEWKDQETWSKDKGKGYVKKWNWEKEHGEMNAHGKKASHADNHHKKSHGNKDALKKYQDKNVNKYNHRHYNAEKNWKEHGQKHADSGDKSRGYKSWDEKKSEYQKLQKILEKSSNKKHHGQQMDDEDQGDHEK